MKKALLYTIVAALTLSVSPTANAQDAQRSAIEQEAAPVTVSVCESTVHIKNADKMSVEIYNLAGVRVASYRIDSPEKVLDLNHLPKGYYILKIGKVARKVQLR